jgi:hypothetical protein
MCVLESLLMFEKTSYKKKLIQTSNQYLLKYVQYLVLNLKGHYTLSSLDQKYSMINFNKEFKSKNSSQCVHQK